MYQDPETECMAALASNDEKKFLFVVNGTVMTWERRPIYIKAQGSRLITFIHKTVKNKLASLEVPVDIWENLYDVLYAKTYAGFDFSKYLELPELRFSVKVNQAFGLLFIESPFITLIKECIHRMKDSDISRIYIPNLPADFSAKFREDWDRLKETFQLDAVLQYANLVNFLEKKIDRKLYFPANRIFRSHIVPDKVNFLHLFFNTVGVYNPFFADSELVNRYRDTWFYDVKENYRLFPRAGKDYELRCMTVVDFCRSLSLNRKIGFDSRTAILFLYSLMYVGTIRTIRLPFKDAVGYYVVNTDIDTGKALQAWYVETEQEANARMAGSSNYVSMQVNALDAFSIQEKLGGDSMKSKEVAEVLSTARLERRKR